MTRRPSADNGLVIDSTEEMCPQTPRVDSAQGLDANLPVRLKRPPP
jgi:hypothetical protein